MQQIDKNTVPVKGQIKSGGPVTVEKAENDGIRVMFVGNSITRHAVAAHIGWHWNYGMAASAKEKDYVHLLMSKISEKYANAAYCICQVWEWEGNYRNGSAVLEKYAAAREFNADLIIMRSCENCRKTEWDAEAFNREYKALIDYLNATGRATVVLTTSFWPFAADEEIKKVADERGYPIAYLGDLGEDDSMKAIGVFEHSGVANHPGDKGMQAIADRIYALL